MNLTAVALLVITSLPPASWAQQAGGEVELDVSELDANAIDVESSAPLEAAERGADLLTYRVSYQLLGAVDARERRGLENNRLSLLVKYQNPFAENWLLQCSVQGKLYGSQDYEYIGNGDNTDTEGRLNELFIQHSFGRQSLKLGRQTIVWGLTTGNSVLDVLNTTEIRDFSIIDIEDARLNQPFLVWDVYGKAGTLSTFVNLYPQFNPVLEPHSPLAPPRMVRLPSFARRDNLVETGTQYRWSRGRSDFAVSAAYLYENALRYRVSATAPVLVPLTNDYALLGFSANRAFGKLLLSADLAYSDGAFADLVDGQTLRPRQLKKDRIGASLGLEYALSPEQQVLLTLRGESYLDQRAGLRTNEVLVNDDVFGSYLVRYNRQLRNATIVLSGSLQGDWQGDVALGSLGARVSLSDTWSFFTQLIQTRASARSGMAFLDGDVRVEFTLSRAF